jgi:Mn2+/Fe2+ NRAMP family transporter
MPYRPKLNFQKLRRLGPGLIFAAVTIGASHLVMSTRAGAMYGLGMLVFVIFAMTVKYPSFRFGQQYASVAKVSLLEGFRRQGTWVLILYLLMLLGSVFPALAAVALVAGGLAATSFGLDLPPQLLAAGLLLLCATVVVIGRYHWLELIVKVLIVIMFFATLVATVVALPLIQWEPATVGFRLDYALPEILIIATLIGWMPAPLDTAILQSLWTLEKSRDLQEDLDWKQSSPDFHIGYLSSGILACCFLLIGAAIMHGREITLVDDPTGFAVQLIGLYRELLGNWSEFIISVSAFAVMFSTVLVAVDGYPRALANLLARFREEEASRSIEHRGKNFKLFVACTLFLCLGAIVILFFFMGSFFTLILIATSIAFIMSPVIAWLIHRSMFSPTISSALQPGKSMRVFSLIAIWALTAFAAYYLYLIALG